MAKFNIVKSIKNYVKNEVQELKEARAITKKWEEEERREASKKVAKETKDASINNDTAKDQNVDKGIARKQKSGDFDTWLKQKYNKQQNNLNAMAEKGESELKAVAKRLGMDDEQINKMSADDLMKTVKDKNQDRTMNRITSPNVFDKMEYNKVPQKVLGAGISLGAVHSMMNNGGQQTNSQLYNQE